MTFPGRAPVGFLTLRARVQSTGVLPESRASEKYAASEAASSIVRASGRLSSALMMTWEPWDFCTCSQMSERRAVLSVSSSFCVFERPTSIS